MIIVNTSKPKEVKSASKYIENILDTIYKKENIEDIVIRYAYLLNKEAKKPLYINIHI